jgi:hypothetical protein
MSEPGSVPGEREPGPAPESRAERRFGLAFEVLLFQFKLLADGVRDLLLSPLSIGAAILGLMVGGDEPEQYFRRLQRFGRRSDMWINLFGHVRRGPTVDQLATPLKDRVNEEYQRGGWLTKRARAVNAALDQANRRARGATPAPGTDVDPDAPAPAPSDSDAGGTPFDRSRGHD